MKRKTTLFLRLSILLVAAVIFIICLLMFFFLIKNPVSPAYANSIYPILTGIYITTIPFYTALYMAFKLLNYIDSSRAFTQPSVTALSKIKLCAFSISGLYVLIMPFIFLLADKDDAPGAILMGLVPIFVSVVIAVFAAVLQRLLQEAVDIKAESDLTI